MHFKHLTWTAEKLNKLRSDIDPKPQYQRGDAWDDRQRALLIDSMLGNFDIPKIYLRYSKHISPFDYEVADGQQRLKAVWRFLDGDLILSGMSKQFSHLNGKTFEDLDPTQKRQVLEYAFVTTVVYNASNDEIRELFRRLQLGVRLNSAEIRNSIASAIGNQIRAMALSHCFFSNGMFPTARYKADDLLAHAFAVVIYKRDRDMKAPDLRAMYVEYAKRVEAKFAKNVNEILHFLHKMEQAKPRTIRTKWGFVDLVGVLSNRKLASLDSNTIAEAYFRWERERAENMALLPDLAKANVGTRSRKLFDYINAFQKEGATKKNLQVRFQILDSILP